MFDSLCWEREAIRRDDAMHCAKLGRACGVLRKTYHRCTHATHTHTHTHKYTSTKLIYFIPPTCTRQQTALDTCVTRTTEMRALLAELQLEEAQLKTKERNDRRARGLSSPAASPFAARLEGNTPIAGAEEHPVNLGSAFSAASASDGGVSSARKPQRTPRMNKATTLRLEKLEREKAAAAARRSPSWA